MLTFDLGDRVDRGDDILLARKMVEESRYHVSIVVSTIELQ